MRSDAALFASRRTRLDDIEERLVFRDAPQTTCSPFAQVVLYPALARFAKEAPGLPAGLGHHGYLGEFFVGVLRSIATAKSMDDANDLAALLKAAGDERFVNQV